MNQPIIEIRGDDVVCLTPLPQYGEGISEYELVMTKEIFIECYNRWIKEGGYWINIVDKGYHDFRTGDRLCYECSECKSQYTYKSNYCPNCGARMEESGEA